jgi:hypothetical protein
MSVSICSQTYGLTEREVADGVLGLVECTLVNAVPYTDPDIVKNEALTNIS